MTTITTDPIRSEEAAAALAQAVEELRAIRGLSRATALQLAELEADRLWVRRTIHRDAPGTVLYLGRFDTEPDEWGVRHPRVLIEVHRPRTPAPPPRAATVAMVGLHWRTGAGAGAGGAGGPAKGWGCTVAEGAGAAVPWRLYAGDADGSPGTVENGDYPWALGGLRVSEAAVVRGLAGLRSAG